MKVKDCAQNKCEVRIITGSVSPSLRALYYRFIYILGSRRVFTQASEPVYMEGFDWFWSMFTAVFIAIAATVRATSEDFLTDSFDMWAGRYVLRPGNRVVQHWSERIDRALA